MAVTQSELNDFQAFATKRLADGGSDSIRELVAEWENHRHNQQFVEALKESDEDAEAGRVIRAEEVFTETRKTLSIQE